MATLRQRLHRKDNNEYNIIHLETDATVVTMSTTDNTTVADKISDIDNEVNSLKTSVSNGKSLVASAITDKGVSTASDATFQNMADNINKIEATEGVPVEGISFTYTGFCQTKNDENGNWRIKFLTSGTFTPLKDMIIDVFLVGGGGSGCTSLANASCGGGGGYTKTSKSIALIANTAYPIIIGDGGKASASGNSGGSSSGFDVSVNGGSSGTSKKGGTGGSGGGGGAKGNGGSDGSDGGGTKGGAGQGTTTREFGESTGDLYAGGGGAGGGQNSPGAGGDGGGGNGNNGGGSDGTIYTGGGGGAGSTGGDGGSGVIVIRNHR